MTAKCPIVGIGASAGGLDALKNFFDTAPADMGAAFVVIQHLDPTHTSMTAEILTRHTAMPTSQIEQGTEIEVNHVYVIPPNTSLTLKDNQFHLSPAAPQHGLRMPVDGFFCSLASQQEQRAIGIILSGTGSDGTAGLREIKGAGGIILAQSPATAQFDGMPRAAIDTGLVDFVCNVEDMPARIGDYLEHDYVRQATLPADADLAPVDEASLKSIIALLQTRVGHDFRGYKKGTLGRRIAGRMGLRNIRKTPDYLAYLREEEKEAEELYRDLLINVTSFFRNSNEFEDLENEVLKPLVAAKEADDQIRVWVPGCSTGEEAYSIAMMLLEQCKAADKQCPIQVFATDLDESALAIGRIGIYPANLVAEISPQRLENFFHKQDGTYSVTKKLREVVTFASQNLITDPPFSRLDLISCRNLMIYLEGHLQDKIIHYFHFALNDNGYLFLGRSESINQNAGLFEPIDKKSRIFRKLANAQPAGVNFPITGARMPVTSDMLLPTPRSKETIRLREMMQQQLLRSFAPAVVLTNTKHQVLYFMGPTSDYLEQPSGLPTQDLLTLAPAELRKNLRAGLQQSIDSNDAVTIENIPFHRGGHGKRIRINIKPMTVPGEAHPLFMVTFEDAPSATAEKDVAAIPISHDQASMGELEDKLRDAEEDLQISLEELETTNEELQASNEEMMSVNEELQSANEELETSKEELQAMNEELSTVNNQLKDKVEELASVNDDLKNFVASTGIATLVLDAKHQIGRFTPSSRRLFNLIDGDVGRPIGDIRQKFDDAEFLADVDRVFQEFQAIEREITDHDGACYLMRIAPYRAIEERPGGVIVTFVDITTRLENERKLRESEARFRNLVENAPDPLILVEADGNIALTNSEAQKFYGYEQGELVGMTIENLMPKRFRKKHIIHRENYMKEGKVRPLGVGLELVSLHKDGTEIPVEIGLSPVQTEAGMMVCAAIRDIRDHKAAVVAVSKAKAETEAALAAKSRFLATASHDLRQPLQSLAMLTEGLKLKIDDPEVLELVERQTASLNNLRNLLNSLLDISKLDAGVISVEIEDVDLQAAVNNVCGNLRAEAEKKAIDLSIDVHERIVRSDPNLLQQVLQNLIGNAIRYTDQGSVTVSSQIVGNEVEIAIRDTGRGIPADQLTHVFEEFYQVGRDPQQGDAGLGLGLAIAYRICANLGSEIAVTSTVGEGSVFSFKLPLSTVLLPKKDIAKKDTPAKDIKPSVVMLVDDDAAVLKSTKFRLSLQPGLEIVTAVSSKEAMDGLESMAPRIPDIIVTDYHLGCSKNGLDVIEDTRNRIGQEIPAILVSGDTGLDAADLRQHNINLIFKPTSGNELIETIAELLSS